ncbi:3859_t:CDS:2 [Cetraspora pellucida]|uniref:3859_t:CDS:1 n=1 Tax=Cetraspora pellucida TaxID=1433469 RepID=A0A9N9CJG7_9GLOM|nr:3859_t:CDS:2 [Cetraspora pellucida]
MYNEDNSSNTNNSQSMKWDVSFTHDQVNISSFNTYNNSSIEWSAGFTQGHEDNSNLSTELSIDLTQDQTNISLPNLYNNPPIEWSKKFNQDQTNNNDLTTELSIDFTQYQTNISLPDTYNNSSIERSTDFSQNQFNNNLFTEWTTDTIDFTNNLPFMECGASFTPYQISTNLLNIFNNSIIELPVSIAQNNEDQINYNLSIEQAACFTQDQTNTNSLNIHNSEVTQCHENNTLQQYNTKSVKENKRLVSLVSRHKKNRQKNPRCKKCNHRKSHYDENSNQCKDCYRASLRILSGNKLIDDFIESTQTFCAWTNKVKLEFIPYNQFINIEYLAKGGFSKIYKATWADGPIARWNPKKQKYDRKRNFDVALKILNNSNKMNSDYLNEVYILNGLRPKIPIDIPHELVNLMESCWHPDPDKRIKLDKLWGLKKLHEIIYSGEIKKFPENKSAIILPTKMNEQGIYSSRPLTPLISKALTLQSMKLNSNAITDIPTAIMQQLNSNQTDDDSKVIEFDINKP